MTGPATSMEIGEGDVLSRLEDSTRNAQHLQIDTLRAILDRNGGATYLRRYSAHTIEDPDSFRRLVPLSSYEDYANLIQRVADGLDSPTVLSFDPLLCFFNSSGTSTSKPKLIPFFDSSLAKSSSNLAHQASSALLRRLFPPRPSINKILWFLYAGNVTETKGGIRVMAATAYPLQSKSSSQSPLFSVCVSPQQVLLGSDSQQQTYCHLLCGLRNSGSIDGIRAPYAVGLVRAIRLLESKWDQLCDDIEHGTVSGEITDEVMREAVREFLGGPQPDLAKRIREVCGRTNWSGILTELWPNARYVACVTTGTMEQYYPVLKYYAGGIIPILGGEYFASECSIGINMDRMRPPELTSFVILPNSAYFEFLPFELGASAEANETVDISGLEIGKMYELVVTTYRGLYRYRLGDILKVIGFYNSSPQVEFVTRAPKEASEVFTERDLMTAMGSFQLMLGDWERGEVIEFAAFSDFESCLKHVIVFVEVGDGCTLLQKDKLEESIVALRKCCAFLEGCLGSVYKVKRASGDIGPIEISVVKSGSFEGLARVALENGAPANQYKPPKILRNRNFADFLKESVIVTASLDG